MHEVALTRRKNFTGILLPQRLQQHKHQGKDEALKLKSISKSEKEVQGVLDLTTAALEVKHEGEKHSHPQCSGNLHTSCIFLFGRSLGAQCTSAMDESYCEPFDF